MLASLMRALLALPLFLLPAVAAGADLRGTVRLPPGAGEGPQSGYWRVGNGILPIAAPRAAREVVALLEGAARGKAAQK